MQAFLIPFSDGAARQRLSMQHREIERLHARVADLMVELERARTIAHHWYSRYMGMPSPYADKEVVFPWEITETRITMSKSTPGTTETSRSPEETMEDLERLLKVRTSSRRLLDDGTWPGCPPTPSGG